MEYDGPGVSATGDQEWGGYCAWWRPGSRGRWGERREVGGVGSQSNLGTRLGLGFNGLTVVGTPKVSTVPVTILDWFRATSGSSGGDHPATRPRSGNDGREMVSMAASPPATGQGDDGAPGQGGGGGRRRPHAAGGEAQTSGYNLGAPIRRRPSRG